MRCLVKVSWPPNHGGIGFQGHFPHSLRWLVSTQGLWASPASPGPGEGHPHGVQEGGPAPCAGRWPPGTPPAPAGAASRGGLTLSLGLQVSGGMIERQTSHEPPSVANSGRPRAGSLCHHLLTRSLSSHHQDDLSHVWKGRPQLILDEWTLRRKICVGSTHTSHRSPLRGRRSAPTEAQEARSHPAHRPPAHGPSRTNGVSTASTRRTAVSRPGPRLLPGEAAEPKESSQKESKWRTQNPLREKPVEVPGSRHEVICEIRLFQKIPEPSGKGLCAPAVGYNLRPAHLVVLSNVCSLFLFLLQICTRQTGVPSSRPGGMGTGPWGHAGPPRAAAAGSGLGVPLPHHREAWFEANPPLCKCARLPCPRPVHTRLTVRRARRHSRPGAPGAWARLRPPGRGSLLDAAGGGPGRSAAHAQQMAGLCS